MKCFHCKISNPPELKTPNELRYCVHCGKPMAQPSPYAHTPYKEADYLFLRDENDAPPLTCPVYREPLLTCQRCGRLHPLSASVCTCGAGLIEGATPFPSARGPLNNSGYVPLGGAFPAAAAGRGASAALYAEPTEVIRFVAFRYGMLIALSDRTLLVFEAKSPAQGDGWRLRQSYPFDAAHGAPRSLLVDGGYALAQFDALVTAVALTQDASPLLSLPERGWLQAKTPEWWARVTMTGATEARLVAVDVRGALDAGASQTWNLPFAAQEVGDMVIDGAQALLATQRDGIMACDLNSGVQRVLPATLPVRWSRIAVVPPVAGGTRRIVAMGVHSARHSPCVYIAEGDGPAGGLESLTDGFLEDFAVQGDRLFINHRSGVGVMNLANLHEPPRLMSQQGSRRSEEGILALTDDAEATRLLLTRSENGGFHLELKNPDTGVVQAVGGLMLSRPLVALANGRAIVVNNEGASAKIRGYALRGGL